MNTDWKVGDVVRLMRDGVEIERREVTYRYRACVGGHEEWVIALSNGSRATTQCEWQWMGWRLVQQAERCTEIRRQLEQAGGGE